MTMGLIERGSEVVVDQLASELSKHHDVLMIQSGPVSPKPYLVKRVNPLSQIPPSAPRNMWEKLLFRLHVDQESGLVAQFTQSSIPQLALFKPDIIVAINGPLQVRILQGQALQAKIITFGHAGIGHHDKSSLRAIPDLFVALTPDAEVWARGIAPSSTKVVYIPNPFDPTPFRGKHKPLTGLPSPVVLTVSALSKYKNVDSVIAATSQLSVSLCLVGDGEEQGHIARQLSHYPGEFKWIKQVEHSEIADYYRGSDIFCFVPDPQEAFGMVYLEAMAAGLPIVASDDPIRRDIIGNQGIYVDPHNITAIVEGIKQAHSLSKIDYGAQLKPYALKSVVKQISQEFHDLIK